MSDLLKIDAIAKKNGDVKAFPLSTNLKRGNHGKASWGEVTIAVDAESVDRLLLTGDVVGILYIVGKDDWVKEGGK